MRESGILFPIFSLPGKYGIGCFSKDAFEFVDFLEKSGQGFWQILPIGPTGFGNSPYQPFSAFAINPYFIDLEELKKDKLINEDDLTDLITIEDVCKIDYGLIYETRNTILSKAAKSFFKENDADEMKEFEKFKIEEAYWLKDYALFMAIKKQQGGDNWLNWDEDLRLCKKDTLAKIKSELKDDIDSYLFEQYIADKQWKKLKKYANDKNVKIIGDLPFYVSMDSSDAWAHPECFLMDKDKKPECVAGCPPDAFSPTGQLWGNPIYDWDAEKKNNYEWWVMRMKRNHEFYDVIRIDHFHGFCDYYAIPYGDKTAEKGKSHKGPGIDLFNVLKKEIKDLNIIAEDLGNNTPENEKLLKDTGFPGMKVLQYGFTSWDSYYVNHRHTQNCVVYTGTHDNTPTMSWVQEIEPAQLDFTRKYINSMNTDFGALVWDIIREAFRSVADLCIIPLQDYLCFTKETRINTPGTGDGNWCWRLQPNYLSNELSKSIRSLTEIYSRIPKEKPKEPINTSGNDADADTKQK